jgi:hypothetical protein
MTAEHWTGVLGMLPHSPNLRRAFWLGFASGIGFAVCGVIFAVIASHCYD